MRGSGYRVAVLLVLLAGAAQAETPGRFDGAWSGTAQLNPPDTRCSDARVRMQIEAGKISGRVTWPTGSSDVSGEIADDGVAKVKLISLTNGRNSSFVGQFTDKDFKAYDRGRTCSFEFALTR
jgi:hypothetical protein